MSNRREVIFQIAEEQTESSYFVSVQPHLQNISRDNGGHRILLSIAASCVRTVAQSTGLEAAVDLFNNLVVNHARMQRRQPAGDRADESPPTSP